jgi:ABC-type sugar transport system permease subunit
MSARSPTEAAVSSPAGLARLAGLLLVTPALLTVFLFFLYPLGYSVGSAFAVPEVGWSLGNFTKALELYGTDILFTLVIVALAAAITAALAIAIGGYLTLGECAAAVAILRWLYRWPLFIPFIVTGQIMRSFLGKNGLMNHALLEVGLITPLQAQSFLDWRGIVVAFVWKQTPFVTLMVAGAMASLDRSLIEAARNLGAGRLRILLGIIVPQVAQTLLVALILSFVTMMSVLSVPVMINAGTPTMLTVDMAFRITAYGDYGVANALGCLSYLMTGVVAWIYLRHGVQRASST